ncbi:flagellin [Crenalkalicoccus roseus]|uniref:flagellin n=1 Tax=Crenalkalicoccus roseus TaxID=1485588 RepID=UPI001081C583|nr:flagellin [Crenalkalicoccus roseus]
MSLNSVNTNIGAMVALQSLNRTNEELAATQKRISTGFRVADARDDGAAFAVAERVRSEIAATRSANEQLGGTKGLLNVTQKALENVSSSLTKLREITVKLADGTISDDQRTQYQAQAREITNNIKGFLDDASYNGKTILAGTAAQKVVRNGAGDIYSFNAYNALSSVYDQVANATGVFGTSNVTAGDARAAMTTSGALSTAITRTLTQLNNFGNYARYIDNQIEFNKSKMDAQEAGLGALVDADLAKESARLQALQIRQQLGTQSLSIANQAPQALLSLFR